MNFWMPVYCPTVSFKKPPGELGKREGMFYTDVGGPAESSDRHLGPWCCKRRNGRKKLAESSGSASS